MIYSNDAINVLAAKTYKGIGRAWIAKNLRGSKKENVIVSLLNRDVKDKCVIITQEEFEARKEVIRKKILEMEGCMDGVISIADDGFPSYRGHVNNSDQPVALFYRGDINLLQINNKNIAVIGLLNPDPYIEKIEQEVVSQLVNHGATIISGLALGCDTIAHRQSLRYKGKTVAILPSPLNNILPAQNRELADEIVKKGGVLVTEYYIDVKSRRELVGRYQERDRLQALFSDCIVLTASYAKNDQGNDSGSRLAMEYAQKYSIPRAVIYDQESDAINPKYDLNRQLIKEDKEITVISRKNISFAVKKIISMGSLLTPDKYRQQGLFDF